MDKFVEFKIQLNNYMADILNEESFKTNLKSSIKSELKKFLLERNHNLLETEAYKNIKFSLRSDLMSSLNDKSLKRNIHQFIDNNLKSFESSGKTLGAVIPPAAVNSIKVYIYNNSDIIVSSIKEILTSKSAEKKITEEINNILRGLSPMISRFVSSSTIYSRLVTGISDYLKDSKNVNDIVNIINSKLDETMKRKVSEFTAYFPAEGRKSLIDSVAEGVMKNFLSENIIDISLDKLESVIKDRLLSLNNNSEVVINQIDSLVDSFFKDNYLSLLENEKTRELIDRFSMSIAEKLLNKPLIELI